MPTRFHLSIRRIARTARPLRATCASVAVMLAALAMAQTAGAASWAVQPSVNITGSPITEFHGVSCPAATACMAVGDDLIAGGFDALPEVWDGTSWQTAFLKPGDPLHSATSSFLYGVSCPSATRCESVGTYQSPALSGAWAPLAEVWDGTLGRFSVSSQPMPVPLGAIYTQLNGVSCTSTTACTGVGFFDDSTGSHALAEVFDGTSWTIQPTAPGVSDLNGVSCTSTTACMAVGYSHNGNEAESWNGTSWRTVLTGTFNGASSSGLNGVSCTSPTACIAVGDFDKGGSRFTLGVSWNGSGWTLLNTYNPSASVNQLLGVSCTLTATNIVRLFTTSCKAVGTWGSQGLGFAMSQIWDGSNWSYQATANPGASNNSLNGVSCSSKTACTAVGHYANGSSAFLPLAERFSSASGPHGLSLTPTGGVLELLRKARTLELLVFKRDKRETFIGAVPLGKHRAGRSSSHWNLRVNGRRLRAGGYRAELVAYGPTFSTDGPSVTFKLTKGGRIQVTSATCSVAAAANGRC